MMIDANDKYTQTLDLGEQPKRRGRPAKGQALSNAERQRLWRERQKAQRNEKSATGPSWEDARALIAQIDSMSEELEQASGGISRGSGSHRIIGPMFTDALGGADAAAQIEALRADLERRSEQQKVALEQLERSATAERQRLQRALDELREERDSAVRDREALRTEMQADIDYWRTHAGEWQAYAESLEPQDDQPSPGPGL